MPSLTGGQARGPGGPHKRWVVPPSMGASMPAGLMLRNRLLNGFISKNEVLTLSREDLVISGPVVAEITARETDPLPGTFAGIIVRLDGPEPHDRTPADDPAVNPLSPGTPDYDFYSLEVVQRIGYDSFCPDNGVLIAKNKDKESSNGGPNQFNCFNWVIDAHPEDINMVDYIGPDGQKVMRTIADYRQLNDALFHAGLNSGSSFEFVDSANNLHFYIIDIRKNENGILVYKTGISSLTTGEIPKREFELMPPVQKKLKGESGYVLFTLKNTGEPAGSDPSLHFQNTLRWLNNDIYRLSINTDDPIGKAQLLNSIVALEPGESREIPVYVSASGFKGKKIRFLLSARSETDPKALIVKKAVIRFRN
jgi:hypothetical protein